MKYPYWICGNLDCSDCGRTIYSHEAAESLKQMCQTCNRRSLVATWNGELKRIKQRIADGAKVIQVKKKPYFKPWIVPFRDWAKALPMDQFYRWYSIIRNDRTVVGGRMNK